MKPYKVYLINSLITVLICTLFLVGTAYAATGCFTDTNGHWAETFICWMKDNGISTGYGGGLYKPENNVTRAEMSVFLQKTYNLANSSAQTKANTAETNAKTYADSLVNVPPSAGEIRINSGPHNWYKWGPQSGVESIKYLYDGFSVFRSSIANTSAFLQMEPEFPSALYGRVLNVTGVEYCYTASANAYVNSFSVRKYEQTSGVAVTDIALVSDGTDRTDAACRFYSITPTAVGDNSILTVWAEASWGPSGAGVPLNLGRVTFYFQPTSTPVAAPKGLETFSEELIDIIKPTP